MAKRNTYEAVRPDAADPVRSEDDSLVLPPQARPYLRARVWIAAKHFFSRADAQAYCWLWLHRLDGSVQALRMEAANLGHDFLLDGLLEHLKIGEGAPICDDPVFGTVFPLPHAQVVPLPCWSVSWGHPLQRAIRAFAATLDADVLDVLGDLEAPGPYFGSVANYNRLAVVEQPIRTHRLQALREFPPLVIPLLLEKPERPELFSAGDDPPTSPVADRMTENGKLSMPVTEAMDRGRDLIGALAFHHGMDRALVRSPLMRSPWACGRAPNHVLLLLGRMPPQMRPRTLAELEDRLPDLLALPVNWRNAGDVAHLACMFKPNWSDMWRRLGAHTRPLAPALRDTRDFLRAALEQHHWRAELAPLNVLTLGMAWLARRGPLSLLEASLRWHAQPLEATQAPPAGGLPDALPPIFGEHQDGDGRAIERITRQSLRDEGGEMRHCVGGYWRECVLRAIRYIRLALPDGSNATAQYDLAGSEDDPRFQLADLRGPLNAQCASQMMTFAMRIGDLMNADRHRTQRLEAARLAAQWRKTHGHKPRAQVRPLDRRSRQELLLVQDWCLRQPDFHAQPAARLRGRIAGFRYAQGPGLFERLLAGDRLQLHREPDNPHDALAVRIVWNDCKLGYVPRPDNVGIALEMDAGIALDAHIDSVDDDADAWSPVAFEITQAPSVANPSTHDSGTTP